MSTRRRNRRDLLAALNVAIRKVTAQSVLHSQMIAERVQMNSTDLESLDFIVLNGPATAGALAQATGLTTGAITGMIDRLERAGYVKRERDAEDRRKVLVRALPAIEKDIAPFTKPMGRMFAAVLARYTDDDLSLILEFLTRANEASASAMAELQTMPGVEKVKPRARKTTGAA